LATVPGEGSLSVLHLGPAFGTKLFYFPAYDQHGGELPPLILDSVVATALNLLRGTTWETQG
jgi:hypothetical protein